MKCTIPILALAIALAASAASAQVKLERKYVEGAESTTHVESKIHQILTLNGQNIETKTSQFMIATAKVGQRRPDGTISIATQVDKLQSEASFPGGITLTFDSDAPEKKADLPELEMILGFYRATVKSKSTAVLDKENKVKSVEFDPSAAAAVDEIFKSQFDPERRKKALSQELATLPDGPVAKGDSWVRTSESDLGAGQVLTVEMRYEYQGTVEKNGKTFDKIAQKANSVSFAQDQNATTPLKITGSELKVADSDGTILFDREKGEVVESSVKFKFQGSLKLSVNGMEFPGALDLTIESKTLLQPNAP